MTPLPGRGGVARLLQPVPLGLLCLQHAPECKQKKRGGLPIDKLRVRVLEPVVHAWKPYPGQRIKTLRCFAVPEYHPGRNYYKIIPWNTYFCNYPCNYYKFFGAKKSTQTFFVQSFPTTLRVMDVRAENRGRLHQSAFFLRPRWRGETF